MPRDAVVVNRVHAPRLARAEPGAIALELERQRLALGPDAEARVLAASDDEARLAELDQTHLAELAELDEVGGRQVRADVPAFAGDVHDLPSLARVAAALA